MSLDTEAIRARLAPIDFDFWWDACGPEEGDPYPEDRVFVRHAPTDIAALLSEVDRLTAENEGLHAELKTAQSDLACFKEDLRHVQVTLDQLRYRIERRDIY